MNEQEQALQELKIYGFTILKSVVDADTADAMRETLIRCAEEHGTEHPHRGAARHVSNLPVLDRIFHQCLDHPRVLPKIWGLLGWNIYLYHSHLGVTHQEAPEGTPISYPLGFHQDSGRINVELESDPRPMLSLKVGYWLSDVSELDRGNFYIVPGSHRDNKLRRPADDNPAEAIAVRANIGAAVFFDRRLWHAGGHNRSGKTRKVLFYGYGYRWIRPKDDMNVEHLHEHCNPIQRQLLGAAVNNNGRYVPTDEDVPLKMWLTEQLGENAVSMMD